MGRGCRDFQVDRAIDLARKSTLDSWSTKSQRIAPSKVIHAELCDDGRVTLYYSRGKFGTSTSPAFQEFAPTAAARKAW